MGFAVRIVAVAFAVGRTGVCPGFDTAFSTEGDNGVAEATDGTVVGDDWVASGASVARDPPAPSGGAFTIPEMVVTCGAGTLAGACRPCIARTMSGAMASPKMADAVTSTQRVRRLDEESVVPTDVPAVVEGIASIASATEA
jgi:hypothetical protein